MMNLYHIYTILTENLSGFDVMRAKEGRIAL